MSKGKTLAYLVTIMACILYLLPMYTMVNVSLKSPEDLVWGPVIPTRRFYLDSYLQAWDEICEPFFNSIKMTIPATVISTFLGSISGLGFYRARFKWKDLIFFLIVLGFYVPPQAVLIPLVRFLASIGLYGTIPGLVLTHVAYGMPITTLLFRNYYESIPKEILDSAEVDGASLMTLYRSILFPLSLPGFAVVSIFQFTNIWNEFLFALLLSSTNTRPASVALASIRGERGFNWGRVAMLETIYILPVIILVFLVQKHLLRAMTFGTVRE